MSGTTAAPLMAGQDIPLPVRKGAATTVVAQAVGPTQTRTGTKASELNATLANPSQGTRAATASGTVRSDDINAIVVPPVKRVRPTVPPKPAALQRWLSSL